MGSAAQYSDEDMFRAVVSYAVHGCYAAAERETGVKADAIRKRRERHPEWFESILQPALLELDEKRRAQQERIVSASMSQALDRVENGDLVADESGNYVKRKPISGRDAAWIAAVMTDKLRVSLGHPTSIAAKGLSVEDKLRMFREASRRAAIEEGKEQGKIVEMGRGTSSGVLDKRGGSSA